MIGVLGGGQLGRMLALAGIPLGERFCFLDPSPDAPAGELGKHIKASYDDPAALDEIAGLSDVVTYEFENVPAAAARRLEATVPVYPPSTALESVQQRGREKGWFKKLGIPTAKFAIAHSESDLFTCTSEVGFPAVVKSSFGGYDGKGQVVVSHSEDVEGLWERMGSDEVVVEEFVNFNRELSIIAVRNVRGARVFYPPVENHHANGILRTSYAPAPDMSDELQTRAQDIASALLDEFGYVGVLTVELFETEDGLLANEVAPRVHNSGHYSIDASVCSQFENHVRAISDRPLGSTQSTGSAVMLNLISSIPDLGDILSVPGVRLHLYGKEPRAGRKLGHVTLVDGDARDERRVRSMIDSA